MIAAVYARKSTEQNGVAGDPKAVARQIEHVRVYAERKAQRDPQGTLDHAISTSC